MTSGWKKFQAWTTEVDGVLLPEIKLPETVDGARKPCHASFALCLPCDARIIAILHSCDTSKYRYRSRKLRQAIP